MVAQKHLHGTGQAPDVSTYNVNPESPELKKEVETRQRNKKGRLSTMRSLRK